MLAIVIGSFIAACGIAWILIDEAAKRWEDREIDRLIEQNCQRRRVSMRANDCTKPEYWQGINNVADLAADWRDFADLMLWSAFDDEYRRLSEIREIAEGYYTRSMQCGEEK